MNFGGAFRETPLQRWSVFENHICIQQRRVGVDTVVQTNFVEAG
ncbi:hypothetical protein [Oscillatoria sp. FACHB-1407]